jgi:hypothetical protein
LWCGNGGDDDVKRRSVFQRNHARGPERDAQIAERKSSPIESGMKHLT